MSTETATNRVQTMNVMEHAISYVPSDKEVKEAQDKGCDFLACFVSTFAIMGQEWWHPCNNFSDLDDLPFWDIVGVWDIKLNKWLWMASYTRDT